MEAAVHEVGPPEVVRIADVDRPTVGDHDVLIKVHVTTVDRTDCGFRAAERSSGAVLPGGARVGGVQAGHRPTVPLDQIVDAYRYVETGQKVGNVLIIVDP